MLCKKCGCSFPVKWRNPETGKTHNLSNRKFCPSCSPFGEHNTRDIRSGVVGGSDRTKGEATRCARCKQTKDPSEFCTTTKHRKSGETVKYTHSWCRECFRAFNADRKRNIKHLGVVYLGGKCSRCGYDKSEAALDFHHRDPNEKEIALGSCHRSFERLKAELDKCVLLCANCHRELHAP